jgi:hypothetical protein
MNSSQGSFMDGLTTALLIGNERLKNAAGSVTSAAAPLADLGARAKRSTAATWDDASSSVQDRTSRMQDQASRDIRETMRDTRATASDALSGAAETMSQRFDEGLAGAREMFDRLGRSLPRKETFQQAQSSLSDLLERQPLVLGAVGLAIGAAVAGAMARTDVEDEWVGNLSDGLKEDLKERTAAVSQSVQEGADTLKAEIADAGAEYADRVKQAGRDAIEAARASVGSESGAPNPLKTEVPVR